MNNLGEFFCIIGDERYKMIQILQIIILILELIMKGISEDEAITSACSRYGVAEEIIKKFF